MKSTEAKKLIRYIQHKHRSQAIDLVNCIVDLEILFSANYDQLSNNRKQAFNNLINRYFTAIELLSGKIL